MGAARFVGRVGGLAVALGVGVAVFAGPGTAGADSGDTDSTQATRSGAASETARETARETAAGAPTRGTRGSHSGRSASAAETSNDGGSGVPESGAAVGRASVAAAAAAEARSSIQVSPVRAAAAPAPSAAESAAGSEESVLAVESLLDVAVEPVAAEADSVAVSLTAVDGSVTDDAGTDPLLPADSALSWALLSVARREELAAASSLQAPVALVTTSEQTANGITVAPTVALVNGVVQGALNATSDRGLPMTYKFVDSSAGGKMTIGNVPVSPTLTDPQSYTMMPYATWLDTGVKGTEQFNVRISEVTDLDAFLTGIPLIGKLLIAPIISFLQQAPLLSNLLAPLIGSSMVAAIEVAVDELAPADTPVAFTYDVVSFDGVKISTNFFPANGLVAGEEAPTVLNPPGLGASGRINPYETTNSQSYQVVPADVRAAGYNLITWDPRGEFASGGVLQLDNPFFEGRDTSAIITWAAEETPALLDDDADDPRVGMVGGSYGGGIQMTTVDPRIEAIVPSIAWNSLIEALYPNEIFKSAWATTLLLALVEGGARINTQIYEGVATGVLFNWLSQGSQAVLGSSGPTALLSNMKAPTLFIQGTIDALFPLQQSLVNAQTILENPFGTEVKMTWFCGGHGYCLDPVNPTQTSRIVGDTIAWLDTYVGQTGDPADDIPVFQWYDQKGIYHSSELLPFQTGFNEPTPFTATGDGGVLGIVPFIGGSGPLTGSSYPTAITSWPIAQVFATDANNALNVAVNPNVGDQIVGAPELSFTYTGLGTGKAVFAQLVDNSTGRVVGNISTAVPVTLDGREHTVTVSMQDIAYTVGAGDSLELQIVAFSSLYSNPSIGLINVSDIQLDLPVRA